MTEQVFAGFGDRSGAFQSGDDHIGTEERNESFRATAGAARPVSWSLTATARPHRVANFEKVLLAIAGHDLRQPLQVIQSTHELLGLEIRTSSELRHLRSGQNAIDRLKEQLEQILTALRVRECTRRLELTPVRVQKILRQACRENEQAALSRGVSIHMVSCNATILSDSLLLGAALRNLVSNAVKYNQPGGRILLGCRHSRSGIRIDVYDTGTGIPGEQFPKVFEAFTRLDAEKMRRPGHRSLHRASGARNSRPPHRRRLHPLPRVPLFHFRGTRDEERANDGEPRARREKERNQEEGLVSASEAITPTGLAAHLRKDAPIPYWNKSYRQGASAAASGNG
jgi:two-component system, OmpR family, phosphate regulon sensor histidine kinase PhoR